MKRIVAALLLLPAMASAQTSARAPTDLSAIVDTVKAQVKATQTWSFSSPTASSGTYYVGGFYEHAASANDFNPSVTLGSANSPYAAHLFLVAGPPATGPDTVTVIGTTITDAGARTDPDTVQIVVDDVTDLEDAYFETSEKWIGQVTIDNTKVSPRLFNYGFIKYWNNSGADFTLTGFEATGRAGANDTGFEMRVRHHKTTGWNYRAGNTAQAPTPLYRMTTDHSTESDLVSGEYFAWKRASLSDLIDGDGSEGVIIEINTGANAAVDIMDFSIVFTQ